MLMARWLRASAPHRRWAEVARMCTDFFEGRQWTEEQKALFRNDRRPVLALNKIGPLMRLVSGYQRNNRTEISYLPTNDMSSSEDTADVLGMIVKSVSNSNLMQFTDSDVFYDGIIGGRGWWDMRLNFEDNDFGDIKIIDNDPFSIYVDPDCTTYDINKTGNYVMESRWASVDEVEFDYGKAAAEAVRARVYFGANDQTYMGPFDMTEEVAPIRTFANAANEFGMSAADMYYTEFVDSYQKRLRLIDSQYYITEWRRHFIDLETGDKKVIPTDWNDDRIQKCLLYAQQMKQQVVVDWRKHKRVRWTVTCGDITLFDNWSPYDTFTKVPFFPYFRRGITKGLVEDLIDPQNEINKRRMSLTEILTRNANSGWVWEEGSLDKKEEENLRKNGARPGVNVKYKKGRSKPERIEPGGYPVGHDKLEEKSRNDLLEISGINESALGEIDQVQSGRALEARQRQSVITLQPYLDNNSRSKIMQGNKFLELVQNHYTEPRVIRTIGEDGKMAMYEINKLQQAQQTGEMPTNGTMQILNDITVGKYETTVNEVPMTATFAEGQFEEALNVLQRLGPIGQTLLQSSPELLVSMSSLPQKDKWIAALQQAVAQTQQAQAAAAGAPQQAPGPPTPGGAGGNPAPGNAPPAQPGAPPSPPPH